MKNLVLVGGGHSHAILLRLLGLQPLANVNLILISDTLFAPYSGMLPGHLGGIYSFADCHIDLQSLANFAQAQLVLDAAISLDLQQNQVICEHHPPINFTWLSIDIGSTPATHNIPGAQEHAIAAKPVPQFLASWQQFLQQISQQPTTANLTVGIVGGGAGGVELALTLQVHLQAMAGNVSIHLFHRRGELMNGYQPAVRQKFKKILIDRGIQLHLSESVTAVSPENPATSISNSGDQQRKLVQCRSGLNIPCNQVIWVTQAAAPPWIGQSGLATDRQGFILIRDTLQSLSHPHIFATGDIASLPQQPRPKAGVFAVRQGRPLFINLRQISTNQALQSYRPQQRYLSLIGLGDRRAIATWGNICTSPARLLWWWKDRIDRQFMAQFQHLPTSDV